MLPLVLALAALREDRRLLVRFLPSLVVAVGLTALMTATIGPAFAAWPVLIVKSWSTPAIRRSLVNRNAPHIEAYLSRLAIEVAVLFAADLTAGTARISRQTMTAIRPGSHAVVAQRTDKPSIVVGLYPHRPEAWLAVGDYLIDRVPETAALPLVTAVSRDEFTILPGWQRRHPRWLLLRHDRHVHIGRRRRGRLSS